ncbi:hypothetical protein [Clostridium saccharoperbutylacetonicum]|uniref:hypothetical protein n=1 Tax=Clostridium saccharoperbutylacetonicum TaxID=36745 RepID=UPI0039EA4266
MKSKKKFKIIASVFVIASVIFSICVSASAAEEIQISSFRNVITGTQNNNITEKNIQIEKGVGWQQINNSWYYLDNQGNKKIGWLDLNGKWYYFNNFGIMQHDTSIGGFYLNSLGEWTI